MNILETMNITKPKKTEKAIPIDDMRHCPPGLRISEKEIPDKRPVNKPKRVKVGFKPKKMLCFLHGVQQFKKPYTVSQLTERIPVSISNINATIGRNGTTKGYTFEVVKDET